MLTCVHLGSIESESPEGILICQSCPESDCIAVTNPVSAQTTWHQRQVLAKIKSAKHLRSLGMSYDSIAESLGISSSTASLYCRKE